MKKFVLNLISLLFFCSFSKTQNDPLKGQDSLVLELERNEWLPESHKFKPEFPKINLKLPPKLPYHYTADSFPHQPKMILPTLKVEALQKPTMEKLYQGYIKSSFSSLLQPHFTLNINQGRTSNLDWGFLADYQGLFKNYVPNAQRNTLHLATHASWNKENYSLKTYLLYHRFMFNYFGDSTYMNIIPTADSIKSNFGYFNWSNQLTYGNPNKGWYTSIPLHLILYNDKWKNKEFHVQTFPEVRYNFQKYSIGLQGTIQNVNSKNELKQNTRTLLVVNPYGKVYLERLQLKMGIYWSQVDTMSFFLPELELNYQIFPNILQIFFGVKGDGSLNTLYETKRLYPFLEKNFYQQSTTTPWKIFAGGKLSIHHFTLQTMAFYKKVNNLMIIYGNFQDSILQERWVKQGYLTGIYDKGSRIYGVKLSSLWNNQKNTSVLIEMDYKNWKLENYEFNFHQPNLKLKIEAKHSVNKKIEFLTQVSYFSSIPIGYLSDNSVIKQKRIFLLDLQVSYFIKPNLKIFIGGMNMLNQRYYLLRDYQELPLNSYAGVRFLF